MRCVACSKCGTGVWVEADPGSVSETICPVCGNTLVLVHAGLGGVTNWDALIAACYNVIPLAIILSAIIAIVFVK